MHNEDLLTRLEPTAFLAKELNQVSANLAIAEPPSADELAALIFKSAIVRERLEQVLEDLRGALNG